MTSRVETEGQSACHALRVSYFCFNDGSSILEHRYDVRRKKDIGTYTYRHYVFSMFIVLAKNAISLHMYLLFNYNHFEIIENRVKM